jgi:hypothetical protein
MPPLDSSYGWRAWASLIALFWHVLRVSGTEGAPPHSPGRSDFPASHHWFAVEIDLAGLPPGAEFVPISQEVDFTQWIAQAKMRGSVDERSIRLVRLLGDGTLSEVPTQFTATPQARPKERRLLEGTTPAVSHASEYLAEDANLQVSGRFTWIAAADENGSSRYRLYFGAPKHGHFVQVPYAPHNFRWFNQEGMTSEPRFFSRMQIRPQWPYAGEIRVHDRNELVTCYGTGPLLEIAKRPGGLRRPFLYPLIGPDGHPLTEFGKTHDPTGSHAHHYSLWIAHANVNGHDFWSERGGVIAHEQFAATEDGPVFARVTQRTRWIFGESPLLREQRTWTFHHAASGYRLIDLDIELTPAGSEPVTFGKTSFGFLAVRVAPSLSVFDGGGEIRTSEGDLNEQRVHLRRARWIDQSGPVAPGTWNGIAMFDHPDNPNHPTGWHCRNDGWAGASFNLDAPYELAPGNTLALRYRLYLHRENAVRGEVARRYAEYIAVPRVSFGEVRSFP